MITLLVLTLLLPIFCDARININITVATHRDDAVIKFSGSDLKLITEHEISLFNVSIPNLNHGMRVELGRVPDGIFFKDPTPYGNLYQKYKWPEVRRNVHVENVEIKDVITEEVVLGLHEHSNNGTAKDFPERALFTKVENTFYFSWSEKGLPDEKIISDVVINCSINSFQYKNLWRVEGLQAMNVKFGKTDNRTVAVKPGKGIIMKLTAIKTVFIVYVTYKAQLTGNLIADYERLYGKYHFYAPTVDNIMKAGGIVNDIKTREKIEIMCYEDPKLVVYDRDTGAVIKLHRRKKLFIENWKTYHLV